MIDQAGFVAGALSLDFVNTVGGIRSGPHDDKLERYSDLLDWAVQGGALSRPAADTLAARARREPVEAARQLEEAKCFREALHAVFAAHLAGHAPPQEDVDRVNGKIGEALSHARLRPERGRYAWGWEEAGALDAPLWAVARDAGDLLTEGRLERVTECASDTCGWFFLDSTKNHSRRWCDMKGCGNRDKVRRYRTKAAR
jgi:predicted RNA-binding Zn ribbon-like protein